MTELLTGPPRWRERDDQADVAERDAGNAIRWLPDPTTLTGPELARIAARIRANRARSPRLWLVLAASLLLGVATAASAARLDLLPSWLGGQLTEQEPAPGPPPARPHRSRTYPPRSTPSSTVETPPPAAFTASAVTDLSGAVMPAPATSPPAALAPSREPHLQTTPAPTVARPTPTAPAVPRPARGGPTALPPGLSGTKVPGVPEAAPRPTIREQAPAEVRQPDPTSATPSRAPAPASARATESSSIPPPVPVQTTPEPRLGPKLALVDLHDSNRTRTTRTTVAPVSAPDPAKVLGEAMRLLRSEHTPEAALAMLDRNRSVLEESMLKHEVLLIRVEALLASRRNGDALRVLDATSLQDEAASRTLLVTRGDLRAAANRCAEGIADFDRVLARALDRRALSGRARCWKALGDDARARADLERYRREFPGDPVVRVLERRILQR